MSIVSVSDIHIWDNSNLDTIKQFCDLMRTIKPEKIIYNGDIGDPWYSRWEYILATQPWQELTKLCQERNHMGCKDIWICENHDYSAKKGYLPLELIHGVYKLNGITFMHGWNFDAIWNLSGFLPGIAPLAFWLSTHYPVQSIKLWDFMRRVFKIKTVNQLKEEYIKSLDSVGYLNSLNSEELKKKWSRHIGVIHLRALEYALNNDVKLIIGHTHYPATLYDRVFDSGSIVETKSLIQIKDDKINIIDLNGEVIHGGNSN